MLFDYLNNKTKQHMREFDHTLNVFVDYKVNEMSKSRLELYKDKELAAKSTLVGPHRDNFEIYIDKRNIAFFGSRGQQRSTLLALKLSEIDFFAEKTGDRPVLLLDDIFSELDSKHKKAVFEVIHMQQTIITSTESLEGLDGYKEIKLS